MRCLGIAIKKNEICYSVVDGDKMDTALIYEIGKQNYRSESPSLMMDFSNIFIELVTKYRPDRVAYKLYLDTTMQQRVEVSERSSKWITAGKKAKIERFEKFFSPQKFKNEEMAATLVAWYALED